jgi:hypothetical protein
MRYRVFMMLLANSVTAPAAPALARASGSAQERRVRALQLEPRRLFIEPRLLPYVADVSILRASVLPPSDRIAVHLELYGVQDPASAYAQLLHVRANTLWPVARIAGAGGVVTQVSLLADRRGRVKTEYRVEGSEDGQLVTGQHGVTIDRVETSARGHELHGRAWHRTRGARAFSAVVRRDDIGYTFDLGKIGGHWLRLDVLGKRLTGFSALTEG